MMPHSEISKITDGALSIEKHESMVIGDGIMATYAPRFEDGTARGAFEISVTYRMLVVKKAVILSPEDFRLFRMALEVAENEHRRLAEGAEGQLPE